MEGLTPSSTVAWISHTGAAVVTAEAVTLGIDVVVLAVVIGGAAVRGAYGHSTGAPPLPESLGAVVVVGAPAKSVYE
jgi:hypothetical protein